MPNSIHRRLLIAAACIAATQAGLSHLRYRSELQAARGARCEVTELPLQLDKWQGTSSEINEQLFAHIGGLSATDRIYASPEGQQAFVHLAAYSVNKPDYPHSPEECYPGAGWTILENKWWDYGNGRRFRWMIVEREGVKAGVAYWYQLGSHVRSNRDDLRSLMQKMRWRGEPFPPLVKVMVQVPIESSEAASRLIAEEIGDEIYEWVGAHSNGPPGPIEAKPK